MQWHTLCPTIRRAIMREAARRGIPVDIYFAQIGG
jgi:hypothetical protein